MSATLTPPKIQVVPHTVVTPPRFAPSRVVGEMSVEEWFTFLTNSKEKYDYVYGKAVQAAGATLEHNIISADTGFALTLALRQANLKCRVLGSDMKVFINDSLYYFPDMSVVCGTPVTDLKESLRNPVGIVEVLSDSTEQDDRTVKFRDYQGIPSLRHYILIAQHLPSITHYEKRDDGFWAIVGDYADLSESLTLSFEGVVVSVPLAEIYGGVAFEEDGVPEK